MTKVDIWNMALGAVGHDTRVESETEDSAEAGRCRLFWDLARRACLRRADWGFAMERGPLGRAAAVDAHGAWYPAPRAVRLCGVWDAAGRPVRARLERGMILLAVGGEGATARYVRDSEDPDEWDAEFASCMVFRLAEALAFPMTGKSSLTQAMHERWLSALGEAKQDDADESRETGRPAEMYAQARA